MSRVARLLVRVFFRRIDIEGASRLPAGRPLVLVANHVNGLVDGLVLMAMLPRYPRFLGKSTLFKIVPLAPFLHLAGVVPVHRATDATDASGGRGQERNDAAFRTSRALLAERGLVALFPEGISHDEARLQPLRTGAARIALGAAFDDGVPDLATVAVGLIYDDKARFRSQALVRIGAAEDVEPWSERYRRDPAATVRAFTEHLGAQLSEVVPMYASRQDELAFRRLACLLATDPAERDDIARGIAAAAARPDTTDQVTELTEAAHRYEADLAAIGLRDADVAGGLSPDRYRRRLRGSVAAAVVTAPLAAVGAALHLLPYQVMRRIGARPANEGMRATVKLLGCTVLFSALYSALAVVAGRRRGPLAALAAFAAGPLTGYVTVRWAERVHQLDGIARARAVVAQRADLVPELTERRRALVAATTEIVSRPGSPSLPAAAGR